MGDLLLRSWNWFRRFRHRRGYGVHSPSDFFLITFVVYEQMPFYAYSPLHHLRRVVAHLPHYREKTDRLLFRLANHLRPKQVFDIGTGSGLTARYLAEARANARLYSFSERKEDAVERILSARSNITYITGGITEEMRRLLAGNIRPDLVHIAHTPHYKALFEELLPFMDNDKCMIIGKPYADAEKKRWWKSVINDPRTGVTFDLYDIGLVFFDKNRVKEHRIVNFL